MTDRPTVGENDPVVSPNETERSRSPRRRSRAGPYLTIIQCINTRDIEVYCGNVFLGAMTPTEPGSSDEVAEIFTTALIELFGVLGRMSNHERMLVAEEMRKQMDLTSAPSGPGLLATGTSCNAGLSNAILWKAIS
ncbi:MAG: hypothetical protein RIF42_07970 [Parvibaculaceae bacterium]|uniref:hypothetical protein n=1 Tax=Marinovum TaxID=367771 RepID=UPI00237C487E|nr:hypothetical protein [Marinovum sp. PR37]MDD9746057.1 hypothetical protein [Marinovum sp. PR37]